MYLDIPKVFTAVAEWFAIFVFYLANGKKNWRNRCIMMLGLPVFILLQIGIGKAPVFLWMPGMILAFALMIAGMYFTAAFRLNGIIHCWATVFMWAEFTAAFEWQLDSFLVDHNFWLGMPFMLLFPFLIYGVMYLILFMVMKAYYREEIIRELKTEEAVRSVIIAIAFWCLGNLSYTFSGTPFSIPVDALRKSSIFYIRTLADLCGVVLLLLNQVHLREIHLRKELLVIQSIHQNQLKQYEISKANIDVLNRRYHDMKHQLRAIRHEENVEKKNTELKGIEEELRRFEAQSKTGNEVLDTIITEKRLYCAEHQITMNCIINGELLKNYDTIDICTIFGNALDNAIEYEESIPDPEKRMIRVMVHEKNNFTVICVENYTEEKLEIRSGLMKTHKSDSFFHGYGLRSMRDTAEKNKGGMTFSQEDNWVQLKIVLPKKENSIE